SDPARQRRLRHPHRHRGRDRPYHADRRTYRTELHPQLAGAKQSGPTAATVFALRRSCARRERAGARNLDRNAAAGRVRHCVDDCRIAAGRPACALGRRPYVRRSSRSHSPVGYAFVPIGFVLLGAAILWPSEWPISAGLHAWTVGAVGLMTLAVMTRASLGHTGHKLAASLPTQLIYLCVVV